MTKSIVAGVSLLFLFSREDAKARKNFFVFSTAWIRDSSARRFSGMSTDILVARMSLSVDGPFHRRERRCNDMESHGKRAGFVVRFILLRIFAPSREFWLRLRRAA